MTDLKRPSEVRLRDPLSDVTRKERRTLLGVSALGIVIVKSGLVPSKISALGIEFNQADQQALLRALAAVTVYFLAAFFIYGTSDLVAWRMAFYSALRDWARARSLLKEEEARAEREAFDRIREQEGRGLIFWSGMAGPMTVIRAVFEFIVPMVIGLYAVVILA